MFRSLKLHLTVIGDETECFVLETMQERQDTYELAAPHKLQYESVNKNAILMLWNELATSTISLIFYEFP
jgi:hypothetical protein